MESLLYDYSYRDILKLPETNREIFLDMFNHICASIRDEVYSDNKTLGEMIIENESYSDNYSEYVFPGKQVNYYPNFKYVNNVKTFTCPVSGSVVYSGNECVIWKPLFWIPLTDEVYVLSKAIKALSFYQDFFPCDIKGFDDFYYKVNNSYDLGYDDYYNFCVNIGGGLNLRRLKR